MPAAVKPAAAKPAAAKPAAAVKETKPAAAAKEAKPAAAAKEAKPAAVVKAAPAAKEAKPAAAAKEAKPAAAKDAKPAKAAKPAAAEAAEAPAPAPAPVVSHAHVAICFNPDRKMIDDLFAVKGDMKKIHKIVTRCDKAQVKLTVELIELVFCPSCPLDEFDKCCVLEFIVRHHEYIKTADCIRWYVNFAKTHHCAICDHPGHNDRHCWDESRVRSGTA